MAFGDVETYALVSVPIRDGLDDFSIVVHTAEHKVAMGMVSIRVSDNNVWCVLYPHRFHVFFGDLSHEFICQTVGILRCESQCNMSARVFDFRPCQCWPLYVSSGSLSPIFLTIGTPHTIAVEDFPDTLLYRFVVLLDSGYIVQTASKTVTFSYLGKHILGLNFIEQVDERIVPFQHCRGLVCLSKASAAVARLGNLVEVVALADKFVENPHLLRCYALHNLRIEDAVTGECGEIPVSGLAFTLIGLVKVQPSAIAY